MELRIAGNMHVSHGGMATSFMVQCFNPEASLPSVVLVEDPRNTILFVP